MFTDLPDGVCMVPIRHAEALRNVRKATQIQTQSALIVRTASDIDSELSPMGMIQSKVVGPYIRKRFNEIVGCDELHLLATSQSRRAIETGDLLAKAWDKPPNFSLQRDEIGELKHWLEKQGIHYFTSMRDIADEAVAMLDLDVARNMTPQEMHKAVSSYFYTRTVAQYGEQMVKQAVRDKFADPRTWRKLQEGEDYKSVRKRLAKIDSVLMPYIDLGARTLACVTHARTKIAWLDHLEPSISVSDVRKMLGAEGYPHYPANVGMTFYVSDNGRFRRTGELNEIPPEFKPNGRLLDFADDFTGERLKEICEALGLSCRIDASNLKKPVPGRTRSGTMQAVTKKAKNNGSRPGLVKAPPKKDTPEKKAS
jgi:broad specificity phosphatase PhoE